MTQFFSGIAATLLVEGVVMVVQPHLHKHCPTHGYRSFRWFWQGCDSCEIQNAQLVRALMDAEAEAQRLADWERQKVAEEQAMADARAADPVFRVMDGLSCDETGRKQATLLELVQHAKTIGVKSSNITAQALRDHGAKSTVVTTVQPDAEGAPMNQRVRVWTWQA